MTIARSILSVIAGIVTFSIALVVMMAAGNAVLGAEPEWINRTTATQTAWLAWNVVAMIGGGYVAAWIVPRAKISHAVVTGLIQALFTLGAFLWVTSDATPASPRATRMWWYDGYHERVVEIRLGRGHRLSPRGS